MTGSVSGTGSLDGLVMRLAGDVAVAGDERRMSGLEVAVGPNRLTGDLTMHAGAPMAGRLSLDAPDIAPLAALALAEASGSARADIVLDAAEIGQGVSLTGRANDVIAGANRVGALDVEARIEDALGLPLIDGSLNGRDLALAGIDVASLSATATQLDRDRMRFTAESRLAIGTLADVSGELSRLDGGFAATLSALRLRHETASATLTAPATVSVRNGAVELTPMRLDLGAGSLTAQGSVADAFDLQLAMRDVPLQLANTIRPDLGLAGTVNGTARVTGPRAAPDVRFDVTAAGVEGATTRAAGLPPVGVQARGQTSDRRLNLDASVSAAGGLAARARGSAPLGAGAGDLDVTLDLQSFPLALVDRIAGNRGLRGTLTGRGRVSGPLAAPAVGFDLRGEGISARVLSDNALPPLTVVAAGEFRSGVVQLNSARASAARGLDIQGSGRIPLSGPGLDARVNGTIPLELADPFLAERTAQLRGQLRVDATARGSLTAPQLSGNVTLTGGSLVDPQTNLRLRNISVDAGLEGNAALLRSFRAEVVSGGLITAQGRVSLAPGYPADLSARLQDVRYTDGEHVSTRINGELAVNGPLVGGGGMITGSIALGRTEISVAEGFGAAAQAAVDRVQHYRPPARVQATLDRARIGAPQPRETRPSGGHRSRRAHQRPEPDLRARPRP